MSSTQGGVGTIATEGPVLVIGTGLIGTSVALALRSHGVTVYLSDPSPTSLALASDMGAGTPLTQVPNPHPRLVVVAAPPDVAADCVVDALAEYPEAVVTDVSSVKVSISQAVADRAADKSRYVGSHPMAGRARSGSSFADKDLFYGQPWVIVPSADSSESSELTVRNLAVDLGGIPLRLAPEEHDVAVAYVSHVPQLVSSLLAARLLEAPGGALSLAGQGLRDTTRIASSDPRLWTAIISGNASPIAEVLSDLSADLARVVERLESFSEGEAGAVGTVSEVMSRGNLGVSRIPGKHGQAQRRWAEVEVLVPDRPGELGRLFSDLAEAGVNIEDLALEHSAGKKFGLANISVQPGVQSHAVAELEQRGWRVISGGPAQ